MTSRESELLELHRRLVGIKSLSHEEDEIADFLSEYLRSKGAEVQRLERNIIARAGKGPPILLNSHFDTVPPNDRWTRDPWKVQVEDGKVFGLGSNDAKGPLTAMIGAFLGVLENGGPCEVTLVAVADEETGGRGAEIAWPSLREQGYQPGGIVVGEPTELQIAVAQKGLLIVELIAEGDACHSANARILKAVNPIRSLAWDLVNLDNLNLSPNHPLLGPATMEPTILQAGTARNQVPGEARAILDCRTVPPMSHAQYLEKINSRIKESEIRVISERLEPTECHPGERIVRAAQAARPDSELFGSPTMSDMVFFKGAPTIKVGPGVSARSHSADEFIHESEILDGWRFYSNLIEEFARLEERSDAVRKRETRS